MTETTERFLQEIAARVGHDRVAELYLFPVLRQGGVEGAVAVVAAYPEAAAAAESDAVPAQESAQEAVESDAVESDAVEIDALESDSVASEPASAVVTAPRARHVVYTARYRHTIKGTDRGRWMVEVVAEADAPLITVEEVVRGVVRRSGDAFQPERISGEQFRALVPAPAAPGSVPA